MEYDFLLLGLSAYGFRSFGLIWIVPYVAMMLLMCKLSCSKDYQFNV